MNAGPRDNIISGRAIRCICVVSTGVIGSSWAAFYLARGFDVIATDPAANAERRLRLSIDRYWPALQAIGLVPGASKERLQFDPRLSSAVASADFVQENGPESEEFKSAMFRSLDGFTSPDVILASSSSGLSISLIQSECRHPERIVLAHPFNPPHLIPLVEVIGGRHTSEQTIARTIAFFTSLGKKALHVRGEIKGHIANRLQAALWREAFHLIEKGTATVTDIDLAVTHGLGLRWAAVGPFLGLYLSGGEAGIDFVLTHLGPHIEDWWRDLGTPSLSPELRKKVIDETAELVANRGIAQIEGQRDDMLMQLLKLKSELHKN